MLILPAVTLKKLSSWWWLLLEATPIIFPALLASFGCWVVVLLLIGNLSNALVWPVGLVISILVIWIIIRRFPIERPGSTREKHLFDGLVMIGVAVWVLINLFFTAQSVFVTRDPGIYTITGKWLITHNETNIETPTTPKISKFVFNQSSGVWKDNNSKDHNRLQPQGMHLFPALLGLAGRIFGQRAIFKLNVIFGGFALLAIYAFARLLMKPRWATFGTAAMAASLPMIYFARDTFTEPIAATLTFGALALLWLAYSQRDGKNSLLLWLMAGLTAGAGALTRPDGYLTVAAISIFLVVAVAIADKATRKNTVINSGIYLLGAAVAMLLGWLDMTRLTSSYFLSHGKDVKVQLALLALVLIGGAVAIVLSWHTEILGYLDKRTKNWRGYAAATAVVVGFLLLMARPLIFKSVYAGQSNAAGATNMVQAQLGEPIVPRTYAENTMGWISWYIGMPLLAIGVVGLAIAANKSMKDKRLLIFPGMLVVGLTCIMYIVDPRITPDHIWASRRFVPVILPGLVIFGVYALEKTVDKYVDLKNRANQIFLALFLVFVFMQPLLISRPFLRVREKGNDLMAVNALCQNLPKNAEVIWLGSSLELDASHTVRVFCGVRSIGYSFKYSPSYTVDKTLDKTVLSQIYRDLTQQGYSPIMALHGSQKTQLSGSVVRNFSPVTVYIDKQIEKTLTDPPRNVLTFADSVELSELHSDGSLSRFQANQ